MPRRSLGYLHKNRHGTFAFRWRPPRDLDHLFNQRIYAVSLGTKCQGAAWHNALRPAWRMRTLVEIIRVKRPKNEVITTELIRRLVLSDGTMCWMCAAEWAGPPAGSRTGSVVESPDWN